MLIRFVLQRSNQDSGSRDGFFSAAYDLANSQDSEVAFRNFLNQKLDWFENNLITPERFNRSKSKGYYRKKTKGIAWFKDTATEHLSVARKMVAILAEHGWFVDELKTDRPGYIVYEDAFQIVAEPFRDTIT
ncbi:MAG: hypothetical protein AAFR51_15575 [Pseudomonadota bacterium]